jgi:hypothetical protein
MKSTRVLFGRFSARDIVIKFGEKNGADPAACARAATASSVSAAATPAREDPHIGTACRDEAGTQQPQRAAPARSCGAAD